jgi:hypothetical protein
MAPNNDAGRFWMYLKNDDIRQGSGGPLWCFGWLEEEEKWEDQKIRRYLASFTKVATVNTRRAGN